jgi:hypothetical protein
LNFNFLFLTPSPPPLKKKVVYLFENYGWFILIGSLIVYYIYTNYRHRLFSATSSSRSSGSYGLQKKSKIFFNFIICNISSFSKIKNKQTHSFKVDPELEIKRLQNIEQARLRQEAALNAAKEKYLEEKRLVSK